MTTTPPPIREETVPAGLRSHWADWLGATAEQVDRLSESAAAGPAGTLLVVGSIRRTDPGWDGETHGVVAVVDPHGRAIVSVPPGHARWAGELVERGAGLDSLRHELPGRLELPDHVVYRATYRWTTAPAPASALPDAGQWLPVDDSRVPEWLGPFGGDALVVLDDDGRYLAGVGFKRHDEHAHEIAVGTDEAARGRGLARRLVAQASRHLLAGGVVPTYLHDPANIASARVAAAAGLPDNGWTALGIADLRTAS